MTVTGGGSGTYRLVAGSGVFTELQPGERSWVDGVGGGGGRRGREVSQAGEAEVGGVAQGLTMGPRQQYMAGLDSHVVVTGGGSGTYRLEAESGVITEVQSGE